MKIPFNTYRRAEPPTLYLADPAGQIICPLNGIEPSSVKLSMNFNDTAELSFTCKKEIQVYGMQLPANGYDLLGEFMRIYVEHTGWFVMGAPQVNNDGCLESKSIQARSIDIELTNRDLVGFKVNCGTLDSVEMLDPDNVEYIDDVPFAREPVHFCDHEHPSLSLLHMALEYAQVEGWTIGHVDEIPKVYRSYKDGELVEEVIPLKDEIGTFDIGSKSVYSFLTQEVEQFFECIILFDIETMTINAWRPEHIGRDTNVTVGFRNLQNSNDISVDKDSIYTRYRVAGADDLGITSVNFGSDMIENLSYFLNTRYMNEGLIAKYNSWRSDVELKRYEYMEHVRSYYLLLNSLTELLNRVPLDDCSTQWSSFSDEKLVRAKDDYLAQKAGYEAFYSDADGNFDEEKLAASPDAQDYYQIRDVILVNIEIELENRKLPTSEGEQPYVDSYKTDWKLYGIDELLVNLDLYRSQLEGLKQAHYDLPYPDYAAHTPEDPEGYPAHTRDMHEEMHAQYLETLMQLDEEITGSCAHAFARRTEEYEALEAQSEEALANMEALALSVDKKNWHPEGEEPFTPKELKTLSRLYRDTDYTNDNMFLLDSDDPVSAMDEQLKLFDAATEDLMATSQPQYTYRTDLDNFLALYDYREYTEGLSLGDFLYLGTSDDTFVKLRLISCSYNPFDPQGNLSIDFSNMIRSGGRRYDTTYLLGLSGGHGKNRISGSSGNFSSNEGMSLTPGFLQKLLSSSLFQGNLADKINRHFHAIMGQLVVAKNLETEMVNAIDISAENGFFQYLQSQLIAADKIVSDSAVVGQLSALTANIRDAIMGTSAMQTGIIMKLTADNAVIDEAFIKQVIAGYITVNDLKAGSVNTDKIHIASEDGTLSIIGNTQQFKDKDGNVRIQMGEDEEGNFTFVVYDRDGSGILLDQDGLHESALSDGLIKGSMIADNAITDSKITDHTVTAPKIDWSSCGADTDADGRPVWNSARITLDGKGLDIQFASILGAINSLNTAFTGVQSTIDAVEQSITDKVWRNDLVSVTDAEGNTVSKSILNLLVEHNVSLQGITSTVQEIKSDASDLSGKVTDIRQTADAISQTVTELGGDMAQLGENVNQMDQDVAQLGKNMAQLTVEIGGVTSRVEDTEKNVSELKVTAQGLAGDIEDAGRNIASLAATSQALSASLSTAEGDISTLQQTAEGLSTSLANAEGNISSLQQTAEGLNTSLTNAEGNISSLQQTAEGLSSIVGQKQDAPLTSVRYVRDWLNGSTAGAGNEWMECRVMSGETNIAADILPELYHLNGELMETTQDLQIYTDGKLTADTTAASLLEAQDTAETLSYIFTEGGEPQYLLLDLGGSYSVDSITVWHYYADERIYDHRLEISSDGVHWHTLYDSAVSGGYRETYEGRIYYLCDNVAEHNYTSVRQTMDAITLSLSGMDETVSDLKEDVIQHYADITARMDQLTSTLTTAEDGIKTNSSTITQTSKRWEALFQTLGMVSGGQTNITLSADGLEVSNPMTGTKTLVTINGIAGYFGDEEIFSVNEDRTKTKRILIENGLDTGAVKLIPATYTGKDGSMYRALVHVKSGGTS